MNPTLTGFTSSSSGHFAAFVGLNQHALHTAAVQSLSIYRAESALADCIPGHASAKAAAPRNTPGLVDHQCSLDGVVLQWRVPTSSARGRHLHPNHPYPTGCVLFAAELPTMQYQFQQRAASTLYNSRQRIHRSPLVCIEGLDFQPLKQFPPINGII